MQRMIYILRADCLRPEFAVPGCQPTERPDDWLMTALWEQGEATGRDEEELMDEYEATLERIGL